MEQSQAPYQVILFDGVCNFCNGSINFIIDRDPKLTFRFAALQSEAGQYYLNKFGLSEQPLDSIILISGSEYYSKSTAALRIAKALRGGWPLFFYLFYPLPAFFRDFFYDLIARHRYRLFGKAGHCRVPTPELRYRFIEKV